MVSIGWRRGGLQTPVNTRRSMQWSSSESSGDEPGHDVEMGVIGETNIVTSIVDVLRRRAWLPGSLSDEDPSQGSSWAVRAWKQHWSACAVTEWKTNREGAALAGFSFEFCVGVEQITQR